MPTFPRMSASRKPIWGQVMPDLKMADAAATKPASTSGAGKPVLSVQNLEAWYGESHILHGIDFNVNAGEVVTLLGRNGAGKTTTLKSVMGIIGKRTGSIRFDDQDIIRSSSDRIARMGVAFCPEERGIFASLDVRENLLLPPIVRSGGLSLDQIFELFPNLKERLNSQGTKLSGGEQQMLAIARILRTGARFLMLDEPTEGLAPSSSSRSATPSRGSRTKALPFFWSNRISGSQPRSRTATTSSNTARSSTVSQTRTCRPTWTSFTPISASERRLQAAIHGENMKNRISALLLGTALAFAASGAAFAQDKTVKIGVLTDNSGLYSDLGGAGSTLAAQMAVEDSGLGRQGLEDRRHFRRPSEQARRRHQHRAAMDRCREGRHLRGRAEFRRCAGGQQSREGEERHHDQYRRGDVGSHQRPVFAEHDSLGLRYLHARQQHRSGAGEGRWRHLVLSHCRLRVRSRARARHHRGGGEVGRQGDRQASSTR